MKLTKEQILKIATSHQRQMSSVHPHAIIGTIEDAIDEALSIANVSGQSEQLVCECVNDVGTFKSEDNKMYCCACEKEIAN
jgi:hypothetical protein